jgi:hypothetical protein
MLQYNKLERDFDTAGANWLLRYRRPSTEDLAKVYRKANELLHELQLTPCVSLFERAYRTLLADHEVALVFEKLVEPVVTKPETLTVEDYKKMQASEITRKYLHNHGGWFRAAVDDLIKRKLI